METKEVRKNGAKNKGANSGFSVHNNCYLSDKDGEN